MKPKDHEAWTGLKDGPWSSVVVDGDLEKAESEWLASNGVGAYSMSTVALMHTRRQHGLLVSHLAEDFRRHVVLSHLEMTLEVGERTHRLSTHQFPNMAPTLGYRALQSFAQDPLPRWVYRFPNGTIERTVSLVQDRQAVVIALTWSGKARARLKLRPLMPMRPADELSHEHGGMLQKVTLRAGEVQVQPLSHLPPVLFQHSGVFMGFPDWWRKFEYLQDRGRYADFQEDMWSPGVFELQLEPRKTQYLVASVGVPPDRPPAELVMETAQHRLAADPSQMGKNDSLSDPLVRALCVASDSFVFGDGTSIIAGYPWLDVWSRDTLLALPGVFLVRARVECARRSIRHLLRNRVDDLLAAKTTVSQDEKVPCVDASLWLFSVGRKVIDQDPEVDVELADEWYSAITAIFRRIAGERKDLAWLTTEGLVANGGQLPVTWMEATVDGKPRTPRHGLAVEFQALWYDACSVLANEAEKRGDRSLADEARFCASRVLDSFQKTFWCHETRHPFDCLSEHRDSADAWADPSIRPNALMALAIAPELFEPWQAGEVLAKAEELLLTSKGIRTLEPGHPEYTGHAGDTMLEHAASSHQGAAWPHLYLYYVRAKLREDPAKAPDLRQLVARVADAGNALGHIPQSVDGDPPHRPRGIPAYAIATGMLLETLVIDLGTK